MFTLGISTLSFAVAALLAAIVLAILGAAKHQPEHIAFSRRLAWLAFALHTLSILVLLIAQLTEDYSLSYVGGVISPAMPIVLKLTALWGGQAGSLFFWGWVLHLCLILSLRKSEEEGQAWVFPLVASNVIFFMVLSLFAENPFNRIWLLADGKLTEALFSPGAGASVYTLASGQGLNPLLRHPGMIIHPPVLYFGYAAFLIPFAKMLSSLLTRQSKNDMTDQSQGWLLWGWALLSAGIALGSWWSYDVLGWGGYWGWDPVEVASLLPWLTATALLHTRLVLQRRRIFQRFNIILILLTYFLIIFSIYITRSGVLNSVHAFGESRVQLPILIFFALFFLGVLIVLVKRWKSLSSGWQINSYFNREALVLYLNVVFIALALICLWGLVYPLITQGLGGAQVSLDAGYYERTTAPFFVLLVLLMGVCPLVGWAASASKKLGRAILLPLGITLALTLGIYLLGVRKLSALLTLWLVLFGAAALVGLTVRDLAAIKLKHAGAFLWKQRRRYGAYLVHAGILLIALGITGIESLSTSIQGTLLLGERMPLGRYAVEFNAIREEQANEDYNGVYAEIKLYKDDKLLKALEPGQHIYPARNQYVSIPGVRTNLGGDLYVLLLGYDSVIPYATLRLTHNPLVIYMWIGAAAMIFGAILAASVRRSRTQEPTDA